MTTELVLASDDARVTIRPDAGGRVGSLVLGGAERLVTSDPDPIRWGSYPMAPWAGRIRDGRFTFRDRPVTLPINLPPNAIHGTVFDRPWTVTGPMRMVIDLGSDWPFAGTVEQRFELRSDGLRVTLEVTADEPMPAVLGWHPWFARPVTLAVEPGRMYERGPDGLPTGGLVPPSSRPWDDCFVDLVAAPRLTWPDGWSITVTTDADHWVLFDLAESGICVEPQTGPPDAVNLGRATIVEAGGTASAWMDWSWSRS